VTDPVRIGAVEVRPFKAGPWISVRIGGACATRLTVEEARALAGILEDLAGEQESGVP
jgi:hypothetical protein